MEKNILFKPVNLVKNTHSTSTYRSIKRTLSPDRCFWSRNEGLQQRKALPQTSNLLLKRGKSTRKVPIKENKDSDCLHFAVNTEGMILINQAKDTLSKNLLGLIVKVWADYGNCPIFPDSPGCEGTIYEYLFDSNYTRVHSTADLKYKPNFLIISTKPSIINAVHNTLAPLNQSIHEVRSLNCINLYSSIIDRGQSPNQCKQKFHKSPVYKLKKVDSQNKYCKSPGPQANHAVDPASPEPPQHYFPSSKGRCVKEGAGGFRKAVLLFKKSKNSPSPTPSSMPESYILPQYPKMNSKEKPDLDELCLKYSITQSEFITILSDYAYLKENQLLFPESLQDGYSVKPEILKALSPLIENSEFKWEDFVKFYVIVVLKRGRFLDLLDFIVNFLTLHKNKADEFMWVSKVLGKNYHLVEKIVRIKVAVQKLNEKSGEWIGIAEDVGLNIFDLRLIVTLIIRNF